MGPTARIQAINPMFYVFFRGFEFGTIGRNGAGSDVIVEVIPNGVRKTELPSARPCIKAEAPKRFAP